MHFSAIIVLAAAAAIAQEGIPVTDPTVQAKCGGTCHARDERGNLDRISSARATPEGWQDVLKRMMRDHGVSINTAEARAIVKDLANNHGLTPQEAAAVRYGPERRIRKETNIPNDQIGNACAQCHALAVPLSWRRSAAEWKRFIEEHATRLKFAPNQEVVAFFSKTAPLVTPEWDASRAPHAQDVAGRWLVTAYQLGRGKYWGEMQVERAASGDLTARTKLTSMADGSVLVREARGVVYANSAWRGRSVGSAPAHGATPDDPLNEAREVMTISGASAEGRWFWGQYQEFGFDVHWQRDSGGAVLLALDRTALKAGTKGNRVRFVGSHFPVEGTVADLIVGPGVVVRSIVSRAATEIVAELEVVADALVGRRDAVAHGSRLTGALAIYDRVDYVKVAPDSAVASFSDATHPRGFLPFEAIGYQRGPDGRTHTDDDLELGPVEVTWSLQVFHELANTERVGRVTAAGLFEPAMENPAQNFDVWVTATATGEKGLSGKPLVGKAYLVVAPPTYSIGGRKYVRDLDRWVDERNR